MPSRRTFLKTSAAFAAALPFAQSLRAQAPAPASGSPTSGLPSSGSPSSGLLFDPADLPRLRANLEHPRLAALNTKLRAPDREAATRFLTTELDLRNRVQDMRIAREYLENNALAFALYGDPRDLAVARLALDRLLEYNPWDYFLEGDTDVIGLQRAPEATIAVCCALDWLGDHLSPAIRAECEKQIAEKGAPACYNSIYGMMYPDRVRGWTINHRDDDIAADYDLSRWPLILNATNLKIIPTCALGFAAVWLHGRHPQAANWLQMARRSARSFATMYGLDGSYDEGIGYWGYTTLHLALLAEVLHRRLGIDERDLINYPGTVRHALAMSMPTLGEPYDTQNEKAAYNFVPKGAMIPALDLVNWGDAGIGVDVSVASWVGRNLDDHVAHHIAAHTGGFTHLPAIWWFNPAAETAPPTADLLDVRMDNDWVVSRTGWDAPATVVAFRSGGPANHEHADRNSIIFKAHGERLFHDPFKAAYDPKHPRWLLRLTDAHTAVMIDGHAHQYHDGSEGTNSSWAAAAITGYHADGATMQVTSDATPAYRLVHDHLRRVDRSLLYLKPDVLLILDRADFDPAHPGTLAARYQIFNEDTQGRGAVDDHTFTITRPHAGLRATVHNRAPGSTVALRLLDLPADEGAFPFVEATSPAAETHALLTVVAAHPKGETPGDLTVTTTSSGWHVTGTHRGLAVNVTISPATLALPFTLG